jgi:hypothetical protein
MDALETEKNVRVAGITPRYLTVKQVAQLGFIPEGGIRHLIFSSQEFNRKVVRRLGTKVLLDLQAFYDFIECEGEGTAAC